MEKTIEDLIIEFLLYTNTQQNDSNLNLKINKTFLDKNRNENLMKQCTVMYSSVRLSVHGHVRVMFVQSQGFYNFKLNLHQT